MLACGPKAVTSPQTHTEGERDDDPRFAAGPPLGNPPTIDPTAPAADFLVEVSELIQPAWASFLGDCRVRLPPESPLNVSTLLASMLLTINGSGEILAVDVLDSSGNAEYEKSGGAKQNVKNYVINYMFKSQEIASEE